MLTSVNSMDHKHTCDRQTDRISIPKTALAQLRRAVKMLKLRSVALHLPAKNPAAPMYAGN